MAVEERHRLSSTSALVLKWSCGEPHVAPASKAYISALDLGAAEELFLRCDGVWPHYGEVIRNRKHAVLELARQAIVAGIDQAVILAAGFDALSIELASEFHELSLFEIDSENMPKKAELVAKCAPDAARRIRHLTADLNDADSLLARLRASGWNSLKPSLIVAEGISYYLSRESLMKLMRLLRAPSGRFLIEYLVEETLIEEGRREIPDRVFAAIVDQVGLASLCRHSKSSLSLMADRTGYRLDSHHDLLEMEHRRTGRNDFFKSPGSGWIEIVLLKADLRD